MLFRWFTRISFAVVIFLSRSGVLFTSNCTNDSFWNTLRAELRGATAMPEFITLPVERARFLSVFHGLRLYFLVGNFECLVAAKS